VSHIVVVAQDGGTRHDVVVRDVERPISRFHCEIHNHKGKLFLLDCNSANGIPSSATQRCKSILADATIPVRLHVKLLAFARKNI
jgi:hypothetical protein